MGEPMTKDAAAWKVRAVAAEAEVERLRRWRRLRLACEAIPADLAAAHDARVRAEALRAAADSMEDRARTAEGAAMQSDGGEFPGDADDARFWRNIGRHRRQEAAWLRAEADRIERGGR